MAVQLAAGFIPAHEPDRAMCGVTVLVAYSVLQSQVNDIIPVSSDMPYIVILLAIHFIVGVVCSIYGMFTCQLSHRTDIYSKTQTIVLYSYSMTEGVFMDLCFYGFSALFSVVASIVTLSLMTS